MCLIIIILIILAFVGFSVLSWVSSATFFLVFGALLIVWFLIYGGVKAITDYILNKKYMSNSRHKRGDNDVD